MRGLAVAILSLLLGCGSEPTPGGTHPESGQPLDTDSDGLCDVSERELGSDPEQLDTDSDGLPDLVEMVNGYDAADPDDPPLTTLAFLPARAGARLEYTVRTTVNGQGEGHAGAFGALPSFYDDASAERFFVGATTVAAEPPEHVRGAIGDTERFSSILGETRLTFGLAFEYPLGAESLEGAHCTRAYPFRYSTKADGGSSRTDQFFLLLVGNSSDPESFCVPALCL